MPKALLSSLEHAVFAALMQVGIGVTTGNWWAGAAFGFAFFLGREHSQYEYQLTNGGPVGRLNPLAGFGFITKSQDGLFDVLFAGVTVVALAKLVL